MPVSCGLGKEGERTGQDRDHEPEPLVTIDDPTKALAELGQYCLTKRGLNGTLLAYVTRDNPVRVAAKDLGYGQPKKTLHYFEKKREGLQVLSRPHRPYSNSTISQPTLITIFPLG